MKAFLVLTKSRQRFYELSEYINVGRNFTGDFSIAESLKDFLANRIRSEYKEELTPVLSDDRGTKWVCISDAHTHVERLAFPAYPVRGEYGFCSANISGKHTMMIHGGDSDSVYPDEVYLRHLAQINKLKWEGISDILDTPSPSITKE